MALSADHIRELPTLAWSRAPQKYSINKLYGVLGEHENGDFRGSSELVRLMLRDARIGSCVATRVNAVLGCTEELVAPDGFERRSKRPIADVSKWWWTVLDESTRAQMFVWGLLSGIAVLNLAWDLQPGALTPRSVRVLPNDGLFWDEQRRALFYQAEGQQSCEEVVHGDGKWIVFAPWGYRSWTQGKVLSLADAWIARQWTRRDHLRKNEMLGQGIVKGRVPQGALPAAIADFQARLRRMGSAGVITLPQDKDGNGYDASLLEPGAGGHELFADLIAQLNVDIAVGLLGQNLTTEVPSGGTYGTQAHGAVRQDYLEWDARAEADCLRSGAIVPFVTVNGGKVEAAPWPQRNTDPPEDEKATAETRRVVVETISKAAALSARVDVDAELENAGFELLPPEAAPVPPPAAEEEPANDAPPEAASQRKLAEPSLDPAGPFVRSSIWVERLADEAASIAPDATGALLAQVLEAVTSSTDYQSLRYRLADLADETVDPALERLLERALVLSFGAGHESVTRELDAGP